MKKLFSLLLALCLILGCFAGCQDSKPDETGSTQPPAPAHVDYVEKTMLDMTSSTLKQEVTVHNYVDGDTTHFDVPTSIDPNGVLKARYLCINTPESTGKIEPWGKKASNFTKEKLKGAQSIIIESNDDKWNVDSTGGRHLVWVWYRDSETEPYRCLNIELIQEGLSISCGTVAERYGQAASDAFQQAKREKLNVFSSEPDPDFYYGDAYEIDLKGLRTNIELYRDITVAFEGVVTRNSNNSVYVESYDAETDMYYGMAVYYGFATGEILNILKIGNLVRVVGKVTYYETGGTWQVSGLEYRQFKPDDPGNTKLISTGHAAGNRLTDIDTFVNGKVTVEVMPELGSEELQEKEFPYGQLAMSTSLKMEDLLVDSIYTTNNGGDSDGAMTLTCVKNGVWVTVRTTVIRKEDGTLLGKADLLGKTIDVTGIVDYYSGKYQIMVSTLSDITIHE